MIFHHAEEEEEGKGNPARKRDSKLSRGNDIPLSMKIRYPFFVCSGLVAIWRDLQVFASRTFPVESAEKHISQWAGWPLT